MPNDMVIDREGKPWRRGSTSDVAWIAAATTPGRTVTSAIPALYEAYATVELPQRGLDQMQHDQALLSLLRAEPGTSQWWLGYLDTGADDVVFPSAERVTLYTGWSYVLALAGPHQAANWRNAEPGSFWSGHLPNLMWPADRCWLISTLWDDDWTCVGGSDALINRLKTHPLLGVRSRVVNPTQDMTPPGHVMR